MVMDCVKKLYSPAKNRIRFWHRIMLSQPENWLHGRKRFGITGITYAWSGYRMKRTSSRPANP